MCYNVNVRVSLICLIFYENNDNGALHSKVIYLDTNGPGYQCQNCARQPVYDNNLGTRLFIDHIVAIPFHPLLDPSGACCIHRYQGWTSLASYLGDLEEQCSPYRYINWGRLCWSFRNHSEEIGFWGKTHIWPRCRLLSTLKMHSVCEWHCVMFRSTRFILQ